MHLTFVFFTLVFIPNSGDLIQVIQKANSGSPGKWPLKRRERERQRGRVMSVVPIDVAVDMSVNDVVTAVDTAAE